MTGLMINFVVRPQTVNSVCYGDVLHKKMGGGDQYKGLETITESSLPVAHPGYQVLSDILFRLGLIANALTQCSA